MQLINIFTYFLYNIMDIDAYFSIMLKKLLITNVFFIYVNNIFCFRFFGDMINVINDMKDGL